MRLFALALAACTPALTPAPAPPVRLADHEAAYMRATALADRTSYDAAIRELEPFAAATANTTNDALAYWIHNELTWLHWAKADLRGALVETDLGARALDRSALAADDRAAMRLHALWDRAYLLLELADSRADAAFAEYEALAKARDDHDGLAVLTAFFAARRHHGVDAMAAAKRVDVDHDSDLQDLYVIALAFDEGGDHEIARAVRARICRGNEYLMKPLILEQLRREGSRCAT